VLGAGERLFGETSEKKPVRLVGTRTVDDLALLTYELVRDASRASNGATASAEASGRTRR
jgi:hypothetical protein